MQEKQYKELIENAQRVSASLVMPKGGFYRRHNKKHANLPKVGFPRRKMRKVRVAEEVA